MSDRPDSLGEPVESRETSFAPPPPEQIWPPPESKMAPANAPDVEDADQVETDDADHWESRSEQINASIDDIRHGGVSWADGVLENQTQSSMTYRDEPKTAEANDDHIERPHGTYQSDVAPRAGQIPQEALGLETAYEQDLAPQSHDYPEALPEFPSTDAEQADESVSEAPADLQVPTAPVDRVETATAATCRIREESVGELAQLWDNVFFSTEHASPQAVVVTAARRGDGATQIAASLALYGTKANRGLHIALVDFNLRQPAIADVLRIPAQPGLTDVLEGRASLDDAVQSVRLDNGNVLQVLTSGVCEDHPLGLIKNGQTQELVDELRKRFDHIILDAASADAYPDTQIIGTLVDGALLVVRGGSTPRESATKAKKRLALADVRCLGLVLNQHSETAPTV